jgi:hypothetical protein
MRSTHYPTRYPHPAGAGCPPFGVSGDPEHAEAWTPNALTRLAAVLLLFLSPAASRAQGTIEALQTGGVVSLVSRAVMLDFNPALHQPLLQFNFGFGTDETAAPEVIPDSFSATLVAADGITIVLYLTVDANGLVLAPPTPGGVPVNAADLTAPPIAYPAGLDARATQLAFSFQAPIPAALAVPGMKTLYFDLFDNLNAVASLGWYQDAGFVLVPEPGATALAALGLATLIFVGRCKQR